MAAARQTDPLVESNNSLHETMAAVDLAAGIGVPDAAAATSTAAAQRWRALASRRILKGD
jgi:hypothetical protein